MKEFFKFSSESPFLTFFLFVVIFSSLEGMTKAIFCKCEPKNPKQEKIEVKDD